MGANHVFGKIVDMSFDQAVERVLGSLLFDDEIQTRRLR